MLNFVLAQPNEVEVERNQEVGGWEEELCDGWRKEMKELICMQMVSITFRSHFRFEAQVATPGVWTFPKLGDCIFLCNHRTIGNRAGRSFGHLIYSQSESLTVPKPLSTGVCPIFP